MLLNTIIIYPILYSFIKNLILYNKDYYYDEDYNYYDNEENYYKDIAEYEDIYDDQWGDEIYDYDNYDDSDDYEDYDDDHDNSDI